MEIVRLNHYFETHFNASYLRPKDNAEIDLIIERPGNTTVLIEIKSNDHVDERDTKSLVRFQPEFDNARAMLLSNDATTKKISGVIAYHWKDGISWLFK